MLPRLTQDWWLFALRGVCAILFGALAIAWPQQTVLALVLLFGAFALFDGALAVGVGLAVHRQDDRWWVVAIGGMVGVAIGLFTLLWPNITEIALLALISVWAIFTGVLEVCAASELRRMIAHEWALLLGGLASIILGVLLVVFPKAGLVGLAWMLGAYGLMFGLTLLILAHRLHGLQREIKTVSWYWI